MEALYCDKVLRDAHRSLHQTDIVCSAKVSDEREHINRHQQPTLGQVVYTFLDNIKLRFGEESSEVISILNILGTFRAGELSKKDTLVAIRLALRDQADLKQDLLNILFHREADWGVGDFDFGSCQPSGQGSPSPQFLQPAHQPQMRLPPISPLWPKESHAYSTVHPIGLVGSGNSGGFRTPLSSSLHQIPGRYYLPNVLTSPVLTDSASLDSHMKGSCEVEDSPGNKQHDVEILPQLDRSQHEWEETDHLEEPKVYYSQPWSPVTSDPMLGSAQSFASNHFDSPALSHKSPKSSSGRRQTATTGPSVLGMPVAVPIGQPLDDMPPPSKKRRRQSSRPEAKVKDEINKGDSETTRPTPPSTATIGQLSAPPQPKKKVKDEHTTSLGGGPYIHSLCGKGFSSRSKVKKHHWGIKLDDPETTTGCWVKHNKPSVSWNEHPSCKEGVTPSRPVKKAPPAVSKQKTFAQKALMVPSTVPEPEDLHQAVADLPHSRQESHHSLAGLNSYHSHRLPTHTSFDNLLTAVNVASQIDAPRPQGRIDSVVSHLDAQAAAAEHNRQYVTNWPHTSDDRGGEAFTYDRQHPYTAYGLDLQGVHAPVNMALPGLNGLYPYTSSTHSFTDVHWNNDRDLVYDGTHGDYATLGSPFSSNFDEEGRQF